MVNAVYRFKSDLHGAGATLQRQRLYGLSMLSSAQPTQCGLRTALIAAVIPNFVFSWFRAWLTNPCGDGPKGPHYNSRSAGLQACRESRVSSPEPPVMNSVREAVDRDITWANRLTVPAM